MTVNELLRELAYPIVNTAVLTALIAFFLLIELTLGVYFLLIQIAEVAGILVVALLVIILPAMFRFLLEVADARIAGRRVEQLGIEMFNWIVGVRALMPIVLPIGAVWALTEVTQGFGPLAALSLGLLSLFLYPASMAVLALTGSATGSVNPLALIALIRICGPSYLIIPAVPAGLAAAFYHLGQAGLPSFLLDFANVYLLFLLFSLTGAIVSGSDVAGHVEYLDPVEPEKELIDALAEKARVRILDHAYGLFSRGNRDGGLAHIQSHLDKSAAVADDYRWFFEEMLRWEEREPALFFAQRYLSYLLSADDRHRALKVLSRCMLENPRFRPLPDIRDRIRELAHAQGRDDLAKLLS